MIRVYCDFDGTVCQQDIGEQFFRDYVGARAQDAVDELVRGTITAQEWLKRECDMLPSITKAGFESYIGKFSLDPFFASFVEFARQREIAVTILSDGLDLYIEYLLRRAGISHIPFFANHVQFVESMGKSSLEVSFPFTDAECASCCNCKRNHMLTQSDDEDTIVYAGDGFSDRCPVRFADVVFAKRQLIPYCQKQNITYRSFHDFRDIQSHIEEILKRKRIRHRQEAAMARRDVFMQG